MEAGAPYQNASGAETRGGGGAEGVSRRSAAALSLAAP